MIGIQVVVYTYEFNFKLSYLRLTVTENIAIKSLPRRDPDGVAVDDDDFSC